MAALLFYIGLGALLTLEEAGVFFLPGDISLVAAGLHGAQGGSIIFFSWIAGSLGMVIGSSILFHGVSQADSVSRVVPVRVVALIHRHQVKGVAIARLVPGLRNATVFAAAGARLPYRTFLLGLVPAALVWSGLLLALGWFGGAAMLAAFGQLHHSPFLKLLSFGLLLAAIVYLWVRLKRSEKSEASIGPPIQASDARHG
ncbi:MAG TPA: hypothetical protein VIO57_08565 [Chloroflexota bacterium]|jgi:membrane protein DedA with SNARE-associated domain